MASFEGGATGSPPRRPRGVASPLSPRLSRALESPTKKREETKAASESAAEGDGGGVAESVTSPVADEDEDMTKPEEGADGELRAAVPRASEPMYRGIWWGLHKVVAPRTAGSMLQYCSPMWRDCVVCYDLPADRRVVTLTIDDAPSDARLMNELLDVLKAAGAHVTFFVVSSFASSEDRLETLRRAVREGHELGNHLVRDASAMDLSPADFKAALLECDALITKLECDALVGTTPDDPDSRLPPRKRRWFRPPRGFMAPHMLATLSKHNYTAVLADVFPLDTEVRSVTWMVKFILTHVQPGSIVLLHAPDVRVTEGRTHERQNNTAVARDLLGKLANAGYEAVTLSALAGAHEEVRARTLLGAENPSPRSRKRRTTLASTTKFIRASLEWSTSAASTKNLNRAAS